MASVPRYPRREELAFRIDDPHINDQRLVDLEAVARWRAELVANRRQIAELEAMSVALAERGREHRDQAVINTLGQAEEAERQMLAREICRDVFRRTRHAEGRWQRAASPRTRTSIDCAAKPMQRRARPRLFIRAAYLRSRGSAAARVWMIDPVAWMSPYPFSASTKSRSG